MRKRLLSLVLVLCMCAALLPAVTLTAFANPPIELYVNGYSIPLTGYATSVGTSGSAAISVSGDKATVTLCSCQATNPSTAGNPSYESSIYILSHEVSEIDIILDGDSFCDSGFTITHSDWVSGTLPGDKIRFIGSVNHNGTLSVDGMIRVTRFRDIVVEDVGLDLQNTKNKMPCIYTDYRLNIGAAPTKGGSEITSPYVEISNCYDGIVSSGLIINDGLLTVDADDIGAYVEPYSVNDDNVTINGGYTEISGAEAAIMCYNVTPYPGKPFAFAEGYWERGMLKQCSSESFFVSSSPNSRQFWSWNADGSPLVKEEVTGFDSDPSLYTKNAAKSVSFGPTEAIATFAPGSFGDVGSGTDGTVYKYTPYGTPIGLLPVPVNTTFTEGKFNNMYFEGWAIDGDMNNLIDETYEMTDTTNLEAIWMEGQSQEFKDVKPSDWFYNAAMYCAGQGYISGTKVDQFSPKVNCSRAMIVTILYSLEGKPAVSSANPFSDVPSNTWYADAVLWASEHGIVAGDGKGHFMPNNNVTREQLAVIMAAYARYSGRYNSEDGIMLAGYPDSNSVSSWAGNAVAWAVGRGLITGIPKNGKNYITPKGTATRAEFAVILTSYIRSFSGDRTYYCGEDFYVTVPFFWDGNVVCHYENGELHFYAKKAYQDQDGMGGRLFSLAAVAPDSDYIHNPGFRTVVGNLLSGGTPEMYIVQYTPTDVQCPYMPGTVEQIQYSEMFNDIPNFVYDSNFYTFSFGVG